MKPAESATFAFSRVARGRDLPPPAPHLIDIALLDLYYELPNLGHDSLLHIIAGVAHEIRPLLEAAGLSLRVISFEVRKRGMIPEPPGGRFGIYIGTGGPGHIDPRHNDGLAPWSQGVREDGAWERRARRLFAAILADPEAAMIGICHSFGVLCNWLEAARPTLRGLEKGGKSLGIQQNHLTDEGCAHPWFGRFLGGLAEGRRLSVTDSRLFDLIPNGMPLASGMTVIAHEVTRDGACGDALTMLELARDGGGVMPRFLAVNHHPEVFDAALQRRLVEERLAEGPVPDDWLEERARIIDSLVDPVIGRRIRLTSRMTLVDPLRFHIFRQVRRRTELLGRSSPLHEDQVLASSLLV
ncbi:MAG: hypothetical protein NTX64_04540 [Elusimicrobia bacterium]|nr:hypothetical protein [Elusimicrobiota bacterium]